MYDNASHPILLFEVLMNFPLCGFLSFTNMESPIFFAKCMDPPQNILIAQLVTVYLAHGVGAALVGWHPNVIGGK